MIQQPINNSEIENSKEQFNLFDVELDKKRTITEDSKEQNATTAPPSNNSELDILKVQFGLLNAKLDKQLILNEGIINDSIKEKLSHIEKWYRNRFIVSLVSAPIVSVVFMFMYIGQGAEYWGFSLYILAVGALEYYLNRKSYNKLDVKNLTSLSMTEAAENIARHKQMRSRTNRIMAIPLILLIAWTILIASDFVWKPFVTILTVSSITLSIIWGIQQEKNNRRHLEEILRMIKNLRG